LITGLTPYTAYHCQAVASNIFGVVLGGDVGFYPVPKFVQVGTYTDWSAMALSGDGRELAATSNGVVCVSTNLGLTFSPTGGTGLVFATSFDGSVILAENGASVETSMDRGLTWTSNATPAQFSVVAASSNAQIVVGSQGSTNVFVSTNFGSSWSSNTIPVNALCVACSPDGSRLFVASEALTAYYPPPLYYSVFTTWVLSSTVAGTTWVTNWTCVTEDEAVIPKNIACSYDAAIVVLATYGPIEISTNGGTSWYEILSINHGVSEIAVSGDGQTMIEGTDGLGFGISPNAGVSWFPPNSPGPPEGASQIVFCSADGNTLAAFDGTIYLSIPPPSQFAEFSAASSISNGVPIFQLNGQPGYTYIVQGSTNLIDWTNIASIVNSNGTVPFTDQASTNSAQRFYRAVAQF
jgi:hypothetical protein